MLHAVTGRPPSELLSSSFTLDIPSSVTPGLRAWLQTALAFERSLRFRDARAALAALDAPKVQPLEAGGSQWSKPGKYRLLALLAGLSAVLAGVLAFDAAQPAVTPPALVENWFTSVKSGCNQLEINGVMARTPPPAGRDGAGYGAGCYALAGRFADARRLIQALPEGDRPTAAWRVFDIAHPVADQGEDAAAGPMMELVLEFWPGNFQALYHAGIAEYAQGDTTRARERLAQFLELYNQPDSFTATAKLVLERIDKGLVADPSMGLGRH